MAKIIQGMPESIRKHFEGKPEKGTIQKRELFCEECRKMMVFRQEFTNTYTWLMPWICSDTEKSGNLIEGCGAQRTL